MCGRCLKGFGFPLKALLFFLYAFSVHAQIERDALNVGTVPAHGGLHISWFDKNTVLTRAQVDAMFNTVSCNLSDLPDTKPVHGYADCEYLRTIHISDMAITCMSRLRICGIKTGERCAVAH